MREPARKAIIIKLKFSTSSSPIAKKAAKLTTIGSHSLTHSLSFPTTPHPVSSTFSYFENETENIKPEKLSSHRTFSCLFPQLSACAFFSCVRARIFFALVGTSELVVLVHAKFCSVVVAAPLRFSSFFGYAGLWLRSQQHDVYVRFPPFFPSTP
jgi:hypothetical protein